jgi:hypothetical protein
VLLRLPQAQVRLTGVFEALGLAARSRHAPSRRPLHFGLGKLYRRTGNREQAQEHLTAATTMFREMDMRSWLEQAAVETAALDDT